MKTNSSDLFAFLKIWFLNKPLNSCDKKNPPYFADTLSGKWQMANSKMFRQLCSRYGSLPSSVVLSRPLTFSPPPPSLSSSNVPSKQPCMKADGETFGLSHTIDVAAAIGAPSAGVEFVLRVSFERQGQPTKNEACQGMLQRVVALALTSAGTHDPCSLFLPYPNAPSVHIT